MGPPTIESARDELGWRPGVDETPGRLMRSSGPFPHRTASSQCSGSAPTRHSTTETWSTLFYRLATALAKRSNAPGGRPYSRPPSRTLPGAPYLMTRPDCHVAPAVTRSASGCPCRRSACPTSQPPRPGHGMPLRCLQSLREVPCGGTRRLLQFPEPVIQHGVGGSPCGQCGEGFGAFALGGCGCRGFHISLQLFPAQGAQGQRPGGLGKLGRGNTRTLSAAVSKPQERLRWRFTLPAAHPGRCGVLPPAGQPATPREASPAAELKPVPNGLARGRGGCF